MLEENGSTRTEIINIVVDIAWKTNAELLAIEEDPEQPAIVKIFARTFLRASKYHGGQYKHIAELMSYVIGKPAQFIATQKHIIHTQDKGNTMALPDTKRKK